MYSFMLWSSAFSLRTFSCLCVYAIVLSFSHQMMWALLCLPPLFFLSIHGICNDTHSPNIVGSLLLSMMIIFFLEDEKFIRYSLHSNADRSVRSLCTLMYRVDHKTCNYCNKFRKPGNRDGNFWSFFEKLPTFKEFVPTSAAQFPIKKTSRELVNLIFLSKFLNPSTRICFFLVNFRKSGIIFNLWICFSVLIKNETLFIFDSITYSSHFPDLCDRNHTWCEFCSLLRYMLVYTHTGSPMHSTLAALILNEWT